MVRRVILISVLVFVIFFALSENEAWLHRKAQPLRKTISAGIAGIRAGFSSFLSSRKQDFNEKFNSEIDRIEAKIEGFKLGEQSSQGQDQKKESIEAANSPDKKL